MWPAKRTLVSGRVIILPALEELEELLCTSLLEEAHERTLDGLHLSTGNLWDLAVTVDEAARNLLEFEVAGDLSVDEDLCELSRGDDELGDEINGIVTVSAKFLRRGLIRAELAIELWAVMSILCFSGGVL
jgi:hypothetical protein